MPDPDFRRKEAPEKWLHAVFPYEFNFNPPMSVTVTLYYHPDTDSAWVLVRKDSQ